METYAKLLETGNLQYFTPHHGGLLLGDLLIINASEEQYNQAGWYKINLIADDGTNYMEGNVIQYYIGKPEVLNDIDSIVNKLNDSSELLAALERIIAVNGINEEDRTMAQERIALRDLLLKLLQTEEGDGSDMNPYKWKEGMEVVAGMWYSTPSDYIWEAIADGIPSSEIDSNYFDIVGL